MGKRYGHLSYLERIRIWEWQRSGLSCQQIARRLERSPSTVSREVRRGRWHHSVPYDPCNADYRARRRRSESRTGRRKLRPGTALFNTVTTSLREGWSPLQIAGRLRRMDANDRPGTASHETIYGALYAIPRGELRRERYGDTLPNPQTLPLPLRLRPALLRGECKPHAFLHVGPPFGLR